MNGTAGALLTRVRGAVLALVVMSTGIAAHVLADGLLPSIPTLVGLYLACALTLGWFLKRPATTARIVTLTVGGQTAVHAMLTMTSGHAGDLPVARPSVVTPPPSLVSPDGSGSLMEQYEAARPKVQADVTVPDAVGHLIADLTGAHAPMMLLHLLAAAAVGFWLAAGETALWTLLALAVAVVIPSLRSLLAGLDLPTPVPAVPAAREQSAPRHLAALSRCVVRRGPPVLLPA